jgi:WS/DGAT/MGAT family acyltransferase
MSSYRYERLSAQDATFLFGETPTSHMHVGGIAIYELGDLATADGGVDFESLRKLTESLLHRIPRYRQKIQWTPITRQPVWVDDPDFSLDYHLRHASLPRPGSDAQLKRLAGRLMAQPLDRERPLWESWIVEGLEGNRFAMITKIHHCMIDGKSGVDLAQILMNVVPDRTIPEPVPFLPRPAPSGAELLRDEVTRRLALPLRIARGISTLRSETEDLRGEIAIRARAVRDMLGMAVAPASQTPINGELGPHRRFESVSLALADVKAVRKAAGCTVNDIVLATASGAFRDYLKLRNVDPAALEFRASAPVSVRREQDAGKMGNQVSSWIVPLPLGEPDPVERLRRLHVYTQELKDSQQALGVQMMMQIAEWTPPVLLSLGVRSAGAVNTIITNVPGPQFPLYMLGARLLEMYPMAPLLPGMGLAIGLFSYCGRLGWGFIADYQLVPDLPVFAALVRSSFAELAKALGVEPSEDD